MQSMCGGTKDGRALYALSIVSIVSKVRHLELDTGFWV